MKYNYIRTLNMIIQGYKAKSEEKLYYKWLFRMDYLKKEYKNSFNEYKNAHKKGSKQNNDDFKNRIDDALKGVRSK